MTTPLVAPAELLGRRILVIDDEPANLLLLDTLLRREGYGDVHTVDDPAKALSAYLTLLPDLVLLDLMMPVIDGFALLDAFERHRTADDFRPVLVLTADTTLAARRRALALGAKDFVTKPFDVIEIALRIANLLETRVLYERLQGRSDRTQ